MQLLYICVFATLQYDVFHIPGTHTLGTLRHGFLFTYILLQKEATQSHRYRLIYLPKLEKTTMQILQLDIFCLAGRLDHCIA